MLRRKLKKLAKIFVYTRARERINTHSVAQSFENCCFSKKKKKENSLFTYSLPYTVIFF